MEPAPATDPEWRRYRQLIFPNRQKALCIETSAFVASNGKLDRRLLTVSCSLLDARRGSDRPGLVAAFGSHLRPASLTVTSLHGAAEPPLNKG